MPGEILELQGKMNHPVFTSSNNNVQVLKYQYPSEKSDNSGPWNEDTSEKGKKREMQLGMYGPTLMLKAAFFKPWQPLADDLKNLFAFLLFYSVHWFSLLWINSSRESKAEEFLVNYY